MPCCVLRCSDCLPARGLLVSIRTVPEYVYAIQSGLRSVAPSWYFSKSSQISAPGAHASLPPAPAAPAAPLAPPPPLPLPLAPPLALPLPFPPPLPPAVAMPPAPAPAPAVIAPAADMPAPPVAAGPAACSLQAATTPSTPNQTEPRRTAPRSILRQWGKLRESFSGLGCSVRPPSRNAGPQPRSCFDDLGQLAHGLAARAATEVGEPEAEY